MDGDGSNESDKKLQWLQSAMNKYLGEEDDLSDLVEPRIEGTQNVRAFSLRTGRDNFESKAWSQSSTNAGASSALVVPTSRTTPAGEWVGFIPSSSSSSFMGGGGGGGGGGGVEGTTKNNYSQHALSTILNVTISTSILTEPPTQLDSRKIASEFGNSFSGVCSIKDLKAYIVSLSTDARNIQASHLQQGVGGWGEYESENEMIQSLTEKELIIETLRSNKATMLYDHEILFDPSKVRRERESVCDV
jgi:hypothetical protein